MKKWEVFIEMVEFKNITNDDIEELKNDERLLDYKWRGAMDVSSADPVEESTIYDTKEEAMARFNEIKSTETSRYFWGNKLLDMRRVCIEEIEVDEDGDFVEASGSYDFEWLEIN